MLFSTITTTISMLTEKKKHSRVEFTQFLIPRLTLQKMTQQNHTQWNLLMHTLLQHQKLILEPFFQNKLNLAKKFHLKNQQQQTAMTTEWLLELPLSKQVKLIGQNSQNLKQANIQSKQQKRALLKSKLKPKTMTVQSAQ